MSLYLSSIYSKNISSRDKRTIARPKLSFITHIKQLIKLLDWLVHKQKSSTFIKLKNAKIKVNYAYVRNIQQLLLSIQKKVFTRKLFVFYKLKTFKEQSCYSTLFSQYSSPQMKITYCDSDFNSYRLTENKLSALSRLFYVLNKPVQIKVLKIFWLLFSCKKLKTGQKKALDLSHFKNLEKLVFTRKKFAFEKVQLSTRNSSKFLYYLISKESIVAIKRIDKFFKKKQQSFIKTAFKDLRLFRKKTITYKNILKFEFILRKIQKKQAFKGVFGYAILKRNLQKVTLLSYYLKKYLLKAKGSGFSHLKSYSRKKTTNLIKFTEKINKLLLERVYLALVKINRFSKELIPEKSRSCLASRHSSKIITLPTFLLEGDPCFNKEEFIQGALKKRRALFKS